MSGSPFFVGRAFFLTVETDLTILLFVRKSLGREAPWHRPYH